MSKYMENHVHITLAINRHKIEIVMENKHEHINNMINTCTHVYAYTCTHVYAYTCTFTHVYVYAYTCTHVYAYTCTHVYIHVQ